MGRRLRSASLAASCAILMLFMIATAPVGASASASWPSKRADHLPLGNPGMHETRTTARLAPGVRYTVIRRGHASADDFFTVNVSFLPRLRAARRLVSRLAADGYTAYIKRITQHAPDDPVQRGPLGFLVRSGRFSSEQQADALASRLLTDGYSDAATDFSDFTGETTGPWVIRVLDVNLSRFDGAVAPRLATGVVPGLARVSRVADRAGALAAVNGGYFVIEPEDGTPGDLAGVSVLHGAPVSEAVGNRTGLLLGRRSARIAKVSTTKRVVADDGSRRVIDGLNRVPGLIRACGGTGGDVPTQRPKHDFTCTDDSELILYTRRWGIRTPAGEGAEAVVGSSGEVLSLRHRRGGRIPAGGSVLAATGGAVAWLRHHAAAGSIVQERSQLLADGRLVRPGRLGVVNGGPQLVRASRPAINAYAEGFVWRDDPSFYYFFGIARNPRTLAGLTPNGHLLLVAADGRAPGKSVGLSFRESAAVLKALGAHRGVNLDGGGSTTMVVKSRLVNDPSDDTGERPVGDAILLLPR